MITSSSNVRVKQLLAWQKKRKVREADAVYIVEGIRMYAEAPEEKVKEVYVSESFYYKKKEELQLDKWSKNLIRLRVCTCFRHQNSAGCSCSNGADAVFNGTDIRRKKRSETTSYGTG